MNFQVIEGGKVEGARLHRREDVLAFVLAGNATLTLRSVKTGDRFTYRVRASDDKLRFYVGLLTGSNNETDYQFLGTVFKQVTHDAVVYRPGKKSRITEDALSSKAWRWFFEQVFVKGVMPDVLEVWHEGSCGRCGRTLTVPESIASGFGPECVKHVHHV